MLVIMALDGLLLAAVGSLSVHGGWVVFVLGASPMASWNFVCSCRLTLKTHAAESCGRAWKSGSHSYAPFISTRYCAEFLFESI